MPRKKAADQDNLLIHPIRTRVNARAYKRLDKLRRQSDCHSIGEVARKILSAEKITVFHKDISLAATMEELALTRKELKAIGININQQTKFFHTSRNEAERAYYVNCTALLYQRIEPKVDRLLTIVSQLAQQWLPRS